MNDDIRVAIIVDPALSLGFLGNTIGTIAIGLGAKFPLLAARQLSDRGGLAVDISCDRPVPILQAEAEVIKLLLLKALPQSAERAVVAFPAFARTLHAYEDYEATFFERVLSEEAIDGLGLAGPTKWVKSLTGSLKLLR